ncbi:MAG: nuclease [Alphaproteobacteria bacterium]|nr:nuclease [Alphaproteobacteria bacterium]
MRHALILTVLLTACPSPEPPPEPPPAPPPEVKAAPVNPDFPHRVVIDGQERAARWDDGDTFAIAPDNPEEKPARARLAGFNTLESYGPVHRWGDWTAAELFKLSKEAGERAASQPWRCTDTGEGGGYGRMLVDCPELRQTLLSEGLAHVFAIDTPPDANDVAVQQGAIQGRKGIWAKGAPEGLITSLHSLDEKPDQTATYNRVADLTTGMAQEVAHAETYAPCQEVCVQGSCMVYVPYAQRYGDDRAACLQPEKKEAP